MKVLACLSLILFSALHLSEASRPWPNGRPFNSRCLPFRIAHGQRIPGRSFFGYGQRITYRCQYGYRIYGNAVRVCGSSGWDIPQPPVCRGAGPEIKRCRVPEAPDNGSFGTSSTSYNDGTEVWFSCDSGYELVGEEDIICQRGRWSSSFPVCRATSCSELEIDNGSFSTNRGDDDDFSVGTKAWFTCYNGFETQGKKDIECQRNNQLEPIWNPPVPTCRRAACKRPVIANGSFRTNRDDDDDFSIGTKAWFNCNNGYEIVGKKDIECQRSDDDDEPEWNPDVPTCRPTSCPTPEIDNGSFISNRENDDDFSIGTKVWFSCDNGFKIQGKKDIECRTNGTWNHPFPTCQAQVRCDVPEEPVSGGISNGKPFYDVGEEVEFFCNDHYAIDGEESLTCQDDGSWSDDVPHCRPTCQGRCGSGLDSYRGCSCNRHCRSDSNCCFDFQEHCSRRFSYKR